MFFVSSSKATQYKSERKRRLEHNFDDSSRRNWVQAICNGGAYLQMGLLYLIVGGAGERPIDFGSRYSQSWWCSWFALSSLTALCCANADTWASELGTVLSTEDPVMITTLKSVPRGTNGGVSLVGLIASAIGGLVVAAAFALTQWLCIKSEHWSASPSQTFPLLLIGLFAGLFGSIVDSLLGATVQYSGLDKISNKVVEHSGPGIEHISGTALLDNHSVNLLSNLITAIVSPPIAIYLWTYF